MKHTQAHGSKAWSALEHSCESIKDTHMLDWFAADPRRVEKFTLSAAGIVADFSKQRINDQIARQLFELADHVDLRGAINAMFNGEKINTSEQRAVLHVALRGSVAADLVIDGVQVQSVVESELQRMLAAAQSIRQGKWAGFSGEAIQNVVHIGIGGSDLGPRLVVKSLTPYHDSNIGIHFVSNLDAHEIHHTLQKLRAETTLFIIASKTFGTEETLCNAGIARQWIIDQLGASDAVSRHMIALSSNPDRVAEFGISAHNRFEFWDWVGGRYSVWSVIGMPIAIAIGERGFRQFLAGAASMDAHFKSAPWHQNMPVMMALTSLWNRNFLGHPTQAVVPYYHFMNLLAQYLQQAEMESNGKRVTRDGELLQVESAPVVWGTAGTDAQHAYFQLLHQGTQVVPVDFVMVRNCLHPYRDSHQRLLVHAIAQSEALLKGRTESNVNASLAAQKNCPGNRPSTTLLLDQANPATLGALIALYEHKIFVNGRILGVNSFDQFGVELGKQLAGEIRPMLMGAAELKDRDDSTLNLLRMCASDDNHQ